MTLQLFPKIRQWSFWKQKLTLRSFLSSPVSSTLLSLCGLSTNLPCWSLVPAGIPSCHQSRNVDELIQNILGKKRESFWLSPEVSGCVCDTWSFPLQPLARGTARLRGTGYPPKWFPREVWLPAAIKHGRSCLHLGFAFCLPQSANGWFLAPSQSLETGRL